MYELQHVAVVPKHLIMRDLARDVPTDVYGLPKWIYRHDVIPPDILDSGTTDEERTNYLRLAAQPLNYDEGFPTFQTSDPIWAKLDWEPDRAYDAFYAYIEMTEPEDSPIRSLSVLSSTKQYDQNELQEYFHEFWWRARAQAHDLFIVACTNRLRQKRMMRMNNSHYERAANFIELAGAWLTKALKDANEDPSKSKFTARDMITLIDTMMKAQRVAVGLPASGLSGTNAIVEQPTQNIEYMLRDLNQQNIKADDGVRDGSRDIRKLLQNREAVDAAQKVIVEMTSIMEGGRSRVSEHFLDRYESDKLNGGGEDGDNST